MIVTFTCPWPVPPLRSNKRLHHMAEHRIKRDIRQAGYIAGVRLVGIPAVGTDGAPIVSAYPITEPVDVRMIWSVPTRHQRDADSAQPSLKSYQDGLVDAGVLAGDHYAIVRRSYCEIEYCPNQPMSVRVEITPAAGVPVSTNTVNKIAEQMQKILARDKLLLIFESTFTERLREEDTK